MNYLMMSKEELEVLRRRARRGWVALAIGGIMLVSSAYVAGYKTGRERALVEVRVVQQQQEDTVRHLESAWRDQRNGIGVITSAAETIRQRDDIVRYNQENVCPDFQKATASAPRKHLTQ